MGTKMNRDVHLTGRDLMNMVQLRPEDVGRIGLIPGPRERMEAIVKKLDNPIKNFSFMEYTMFTGEHQGQRVTTINGGRFAPDTAITTEILCCAGPQTLIRLGSCGSLSEDIKVGDIVVAESGLVGEGTSPYYSDDRTPKADGALVSAFKEIAAHNPLHNVHTGRVWTTDALLRETKEFVDKAVEQGAVAVDMVTSAFLTVCRFYNVRAVALLAVSDNVITGEMGFMNPNYYMAEQAIIDAALRWIAAGSTAESSSASP